MRRAGAPSVECDNKYVTDNERAEHPLLPTSAEVVTALRNAGWLLEQDAAAALRKSEFNVVTGKAFPDPDDPTVSREIDVYGYRDLFRSRELSFSIGARIFAECKQSSMPYVVVGTPASAYELARDRQEQRFRYSQIETGRTDLGNGQWRIQHTRAREYLGLDRLPGSPWSAGFVGNQLTRLDRRKTWLADNRGVFTSLVYPLAKVLTYFKSQLSKNQGSGTVHKPGEGWASIDLYYPLVITSAPLFKVDVSSTDIEAIEVPWATVTREIMSTKVNGQFNIDIVTAAMLKDYLHERVNTFGLAVASLAQRDPQRFITHIDHEYQPRVNVVKGA